MAIDSQIAMPPIENTEAFTRIPLNVAKICNAAAAQSCARDIQQLQFRLASLNIIPLPREGTRPSLSVEQATEHYKSFLTAHQGQPIASIFRQVYASAILSHYGVLDSQNYELIKYYTEELSDENSMDFATLAKAARVLQDKLSQDAYASLVNATTQRAQEQAKAVQEQISQLTLRAKQKTALGEARAAKLTLERISKSTLPSDIKQLTRLQQSIQ